MPRRTIHPSAFKSNSNFSARPARNRQAKRRAPSIDRRGTTTLTVTAKRIERLKKMPSPQQQIVSSLVLSGLRLAIVGIGLGAIVGTVFSAIDPVSLLARFNPPLPVVKPASPASTDEPPVAQSPPSLKFAEELTPLKTKLEVLVKKYPKLQAQAWFVDIDNGAYVNLNGNTPIAAASTIKIPILVAFFQDIDAGKIALDEMLTMDKAVIASGSGDMQYQQPGKKFSALETATKMNVISDNTATNMLIRRLGGKEVLNQRFREWGLTVTVINNALPDLEGTNTTSSQDLGNLLAKIQHGEFISLKSRDRLLGIMQQTRTNTLLPQGIEKDAVIAHKTGDIGSIIGDAGIIDMPTGKRYVAAVMVKRPHNDIAGRTLIQEMSRTAYQHFKWYQPRPTVKQETGNRE